MAAITGGINPDKFNIFNPYFLQYYFVNKNIREFSGYAKGILLDIGCGIKPYQSVFKPLVTGYFGIDYPESVNLDEQESIETDEHKPDIWGDGMYVPVRNESVDTVLSAMVLEHIPEPDQYIKEAARVLKKDGTIILSTVQSFPVHHDTHDFYRYTKHGLRYLLEKNGFNIREIRQNGKYFAHIGEMKNHFWNYRFFRNFNNKFIKMLGGLVKLVLTPLLLLMTFLRNIYCLLLSRIDFEPSITTSYILIAKKK